MLPVRCHLQKAIALRQEELSNRSFLSSGSRFFSPLTFHYSDLITRVDSFIFYFFLAQSLSCMMQMMQTSPQNRNFPSGYVFLGWKVVFSILPKFGFLNGRLCILFVQIILIPRELIDPDSISSSLSSGTIGLFFSFFLSATCWQRRTLQRSTHLAPAASGAHTCPVPGQLSMQLSGRGAGNPTSLFQGVILTCLRLIPRHFS